MAKLEQKAVSSPLLWQRRQAMRDMEWVIGYVDPGDQPRYLSEVRGDQRWELITWYALRFRSEKQAQVYLDKMRQGGRWTPNKDYFIKEVKSRVAEEEEIRKKEEGGRIDSIKCKYCGAARASFTSANCWRCGAYIGFGRVDPDLLGKQTGLPKCMIDE